MAPDPTNILGKGLRSRGNRGERHYRAPVCQRRIWSFWCTSSTGTAHRSWFFTTPANLIPRDASGLPNFASDTGNVAGKTTIGGFEGLAISPDGKYLYAMLQSAMLDEGAVNGTSTRIVKFDTATGLAVAQGAHQFRNGGSGPRVRPGCGERPLICLNERLCSVRALRLRRRTKKSSKSILPGRRTSARSIWTPRYWVHQGDQDSYALYRPGCEHDLRAGQQTAEVYLRIRPPP